MSDSGEPPEPSVRRHSGDESGHADGPVSIERLATRAREARESAEPPSDPPDTDWALEAARDGLGPVVARYVRARTGDLERLSSGQMDGLHRATNDWLAVYAIGYGVETDPDVTVREAAELLVETHDIVATAELLTGVPGG